MSDGDEDRRACNITLCGGAKMCITFSFASRKKNVFFSRASLKTSDKILFREIQFFLQR